MRAAFGLVGVLGFLIALILFWHYAYLPYTQQVVRSGRTAQEQAEQMAGVDTNAGGRVSDNVKFEPIMAGSKLRGLQVKAITIGSSYQTHYGIRLNDIIDQIGPQNVRDIDDAEMAKALAYEAYQRQWELGVMRSNQHVMLPLPTPQKQVAGPFVPGTPPAPGTPPGTAGQSTATPANQQPAAPPAPAPKPSDGSPLMRQIDAIRSYGQ